MGSPLEWSSGRAAGAAEESDMNQALMDVAAIQRDILSGGSLASEQVRRMESAVDLQARISAILDDEAGRSLDDEADRLAVRDALVRGLT